MTRVKSYLDEQLIDMVYLLFNICLSFHKVSDGIHVVESYKENVFGTQSQ